MNHPYSRIGQAGSVGGGMLLRLVGRKGEGEFELCAML